MLEVRLATRRADFPSRWYRLALAHHRHPITVCTLVERGHVYPQIVALWVFHPEEPLDIWFSLHWPDFFEALQCSLYGRFIRLVTAPYDTQCTGQPDVRHDVESTLLTLGQRQHITCQ